MQDRIKAFFKRFRCQRCGKCCKEGVGIALLPNETRKMRELVRERGSTWSRWKDVNTFTMNGLRLLKLPCPFYKDGCRIYAERPLACKFYPLGIKKGELVSSANCTALNVENKTPSTLKVSAGVEG